MAAIEKMGEELMASGTTGNSRLLLLTRLAISCLTLAVCLVYFINTYFFFPGLQVKFTGTVSQPVTGRLYWDLGAGFTPHDYIDLQLLPAPADERQPLGDLTISPVGVRNEQSRGYLVWLVFSKADYEQGNYRISGKHKWMHWIPINQRQKGRQLVLYPGSSVTFYSLAERDNIKIFKSPQSGIAKVSSTSGYQRFLDCYGKNRNWEVSRYVVSEQGEGAVVAVRDAHRKQRQPEQPLPNYRVKQVRFVPDSLDTIGELVPARSVRLFARGESHSAQLASLAVNGVQFSGDDLGRFGECVQDEESRCAALSLPPEGLIIDGPLYSLQVETTGESAAALFLVVDGSLLAESTGTIARKDNTFTFAVTPVTETISLTSITVTGTDGVAAEYRLVASADGGYTSEEFSQLAQTRRQPLLLAVQIAMAAFLALLAYWGSGQVMSIIRQRRGNPLTALMLADGRWLFWLVLLSGMGINTLWLLAQWPGCLTPDSVHVHNELKRMTITNHHPYLYSLFILGLYNLYDAPLTVILVQMSTFHVLVASVICFAHRQGVRWYLLYPLALFTFSSIPMNVFNISVWKDIPYTTLVLFWALLLAYWYYQKLYRQAANWQPEPAALMLLAVSFVWLCTFRHNGIVYLVFLPPALWLFSPLARRWLVKFLLTCGVLFVLVFLVLQPAVLHQKPEKNNFNKTIVNRTLNKAAEVGSAEGSDDEGYYLEHYLAERVKRFVASLGTSPKATTWYNDMENPPRHWFAVDNIKSEYVVAPKSEYLHNLADKLLKTRKYDGFFKGRFLFWNSLFGLLALALAFLLYRWLPVTALYSSFFLFQAAGMFFVVWPRWRYLYFLYLGGLYLVLVVIVELRGRRLSPVAPTSVESIPLNQGVKGS